IFLEVMASDKAIRERSRAWSGGWLSHRLAAAQRLVCELSDDMNKVYKPAAPDRLGQEASIQRLRRPAALCAPIIIAGLFAVPCRAARAPCPVPRPRDVPEPLSLDSRAFAPIRPEWPFTTYFFFIFVTLPLTLYRLNISTIVRARASLLSTGPTPAPVPISLLSHLHGRNSVTSTCARRRTQVSIVCTPTPCTSARSAHCYAAHGGYRGYSGETPV
ncbi:hypothetical protein TYRP_016871, partial [Tyrophagus putrescentiae]